MLLAKKIIKAEIKHLDIIAVAFDEYRQFYKQSSDPAKAKDFIRERLSNKDSIILLATNHAETIGYGFAQLYPGFTSLGMAKIVILNDLYVSVEYRRAGIARQLLVEAKKHAIEADADKITLETELSNLAGQRLYESESYKKGSGKFISYSLNLKT